MDEKILQSLSQLSEKEAGFSIDPAKIVTMAKDIIRFQEKEVRKEREKIAGLEVRKQEETDIQTKREKIPAAPAPIPTPVPTPVAVKPHDAVVAPISRGKDATKEKKEKAEETKEKDIGETERIEKQREEEEYIIQINYL